MQNITHNNPDNFYYTGVSRIIQGYTDDILVKKSDSTPKDTPVQHPLAIHLTAVVCRHKCVHHTLTCRRKQHIPITSVSLCLLLSANHTTPNHTAPYHTAPNHTAAYHTTPNHTLYLHLTILLLTIPPLTIPPLTIPLLTIPLLTYRS